MNCSACEIEANEERANRCHVGNDEQAGQVFEWVAVVSWSIVVFKEGGWVFLLVAYTQWSSSSS